MSNFIQQIHLSILYPPLAIQQYKHICVCHMYIDTVCNNLYMFMPKVKVSQSKEMLLNFAFRMENAKEFRFATSI